MDKRKINRLIPEHLNPGIDDWCVLKMKCSRGSYRVAPDSLVEKLDFLDFPRYFFKREKSSQWGSYSS